MSLFQHQAGPPIEPVYVQVEPNESIKFNSLKAVITDEALGGATPEIVDARLDFVPTVALKFLAPLSADQPTFRLSFDRSQFRQGVNIRSKSPSYELDTAAICTSLSQHGVVYIPKKTPVQVRPGANSIAGATFHLLNWPYLRRQEDLVLPADQPPPPEEQYGRIRLRFDGWNVVVARTDRTNAAVTQLQHTEGYVITHVGSIA